LQFGGFVVSPIFFIFGYAQTAAYLWLGLLSIHMQNLTKLTPKQSLNKAYLKEKVTRSDIELFKASLIQFIDGIDEKESEEYVKNLVTKFLYDTYYHGKNQINTKGRIDLAIYEDKKPVVIIEAKRPTSPDMVTVDNLNTKATHELMLYYLQERVEHGNIDVKYLIITNTYEWFVFDSSVFDSLFYKNSALMKDFNDWKNGRKARSDRDLFYNDIAKPFLKNLHEEIRFTWFDLRPIAAFAKNGNPKDDAKLIDFYKVLSPVTLLKQPFANDSNSLDTRFYTELLHLIGLEEIKEGGKKLIKRKNKPNEASLLESTIIKLEDKDSLRESAKFQSFGSNKNDQLFNVALELSITWVNRLLFLKLLEGQVHSYQKGNNDYLFLNSKSIHDFDELSNLFFQVLAEQPNNRRAKLREKFKNVPYLNSSLFEATGLERLTFDISALDDKLELPLYEKSVLKKSAHRSKTAQLPLLLYFFEFLDAYDFSSEGKEEIQEENKTLINASVLGLIFEKINGYKDGSFFTPGFVTMYMCRETIRKAVIQKFDEVKDWKIDKYEQLYNKIENVNEANDIINSLKICDPAVGSGHFLVSALNEIIAIKSELGILKDRKGNLLRDYAIEVVNDELIVSTGHNEFFEYKPGNKESQRVQEALFHEKETVIENCLFGVDINPNSVKICRLRLWIELLKNAYYTPESKYTDLETLPNIDINIKQGNSLISRFSLDADLSKALKSIKYNIDDYKAFVNNYKNATDKEEKRGFEKLIEQIKKDFRTEIGKNDPKIQLLSKRSGELYNLLNQARVFEPTEKEKKDQHKKKEKLEIEINKLSAEIEEVKNSAIYKNAFEWRFEFPEVLDNDGKYHGFDVVIGNPPYGAEFDGQEKKFIRDNYKSYLYKFDSYVYFIELGLNLSKSKGYLEYITPILWLSLDNCHPIRSIVTQQNNLTRIFIHGEGVFDEAVVNTFSFQIQKTEPKSELLIVNEKLNFPVNKFDWIDKETFKIEYRLSPEIKRIIDNIRSISNPLSSYGEVIQGITPYDSYQGQSKEIIENRAFHFDFKKDETCEKWLEGKDLNRYSISWNNKWLSYGDWLAAPREKRFFEGPRILFREVPGKGKKIQASLTDEVFYYGHSISPFKPFKKNEMDLKYLLGIVNSRLISWYGNYTLSNFGKDIFPKLNPNDIKELPIPKGFEHHKEISELVAYILNNVSQSNVDKEEKRIDDLVYQIYGLKQEQIEIIES
jgi:adenine-specific DNA-methyltransferase